MRLMATVQLDTVTANPLIQSGKIGEILGGVLEALKPEATYFLG